MTKYERGVQYIAENDEPTLTLDTDLEEISDLLSVVAVATAFGKPQERVAADVLRYRKRSL
jgi:hypothetical protein